jgi:hypothetical protein
MLMPWAISVRGGRSGSQNLEAAREWYVKGAALKGSTNHEARAVLGKASTVMLKPAMILGTMLIGRCWGWTFGLLGLYQITKGPPDGGSFFNWAIAATDISIRWKQSTAPSDALPLRLWSS